MNKLVMLFIFLLLSGFGLRVNAGTLPYDYSSVTSVPIHLSIIKKVSTKEGVLEGQDIQFKVRKDSVYNGKTIVKAGDIINAKVETVITSGMNGFPAEIIVDSFKIPGVKDSQILGNYVEVGQNRCLIVYPLKWALTIIPFVGSLTNFIYGGHASIRPKDKVIIYYYPEWK